MIDKTTLAIYEGETKIMSTSNNQIIFEDHFDGNLDESWSWLRENPDHWRIENGGIEIRVQPGVADTVENALLRPAPNRNEGSFAIEVTITNHTHPTQQYEQAGITWYQDDKPVWLCCIKTSSVKNRPRV